MIPYWRPDTLIRAPLITTCVVRHRTGELQLVPLLDDMVIGRSETSQIRLYDDRVARLHARIHRTPHAVTIEDANSDNGTWVTRPLVAGVPHVLHVGDSILLGGCSISFVHELPPAPPPDDEIAGLLAAICETPDDDDPRLVLADLLTARGDPRGEFISWQIAAESSVNTEARARADALCAIHEHAWLSPLPFPIASWTFRRGLLDCIWILPGQSVAALRGHHPLRAVVVIE